jgi:hypothetical protein
MSDNRLLDDISFERWVQHIFDHPLPPEVSKEVRDAYNSRYEAALEKAHRGELGLTELPWPPDWVRWHFKIGAEYWKYSANPARTVEYICQLFSSIDVLTKPYTDAQIEQGVQYLINGSFSNYMHTLGNNTVALSERSACAAAFHDVYAKLYAKKCAPDLGHLNFAGHRGNPLNSSCYMWWDIIPFYGKSGDAREQLDATMLDVMAKTLDIDHEACREGALHGLGHWKGAYPEFVEATIDRFLADNPHISSSLRSYAQAARNGSVL